MIIGSTALEHHFPTQRDPKDLDVFIPPEWAEKGEEDFWDTRLIEYKPYLFWVKNEPATIDELYTIKVSHSYWELENGSWNKHIRDVQFLKDQGAKLLPDFHAILYKIWVDKHGPKKMQFMSKDDFFEDAVTRIYDHDSIHDSVAYGPEAMYIRTLLSEGHTAVDMNYVKHEMSFEDQVKLFREEVCATALERIVIPRSYRTSAGAAYIWSLRRTITSLTKGWSAQFIVTNYEHFWKPCDYVTRHLNNKERLIKL